MTTVRSNTLFALELVCSGRRFWVLGLCLTTLVQACAPALLLWIGRRVMDDVILGAVPAESKTALLGLLLAGMLAATVLSSVAGEANSALARTLGEVVGNDVVALVMRHAAELDLEQFETPDVHDKLRRAQQDAGQRPVALVLETTTLVQSAVALATTSAILLGYHWLALLAALLPSGPRVFLERRLARQDHGARRDRTELWRRMGYVSWVLSSIEHAKDLRLYGLADLFLRKYSALFNESFRVVRALTIRKGEIALATGLVATLAYVGFYGYLATRALAQQLSMGSFVMYTAAFSLIQTQAGSALRTYVGLYQHRLFIGNLSEFLAVQPTLPAPVRRPSTPRGAARFELSDVSFRYPSRRRSTLSHVNLCLEPGERVALVGENGAGKSTLVKLLCRLYQPTEGRILFQGLDLRDWDPAEYRARVGAIFQDYARYNLPAWENIGIGRISDMTDREQVARAASLSGAAAVIDRLPKGYDTELGSYFSGGCDLSGGEWQLIAIARAVMRDGDVLILDEPTSSLDAYVEHAVLNALLRVTRGRTSLVVSHRLSTATTADRVVVLDSGTIVEDGPHERLLRAGGPYERLFRTQASTYVASSDASGPGRS